MPLLLFNTSSAGALIMPLLTSSMSPIATRSVPVILMKAVATKTKITLVMSPSHSVRPAQLEQAQLRLAVLRLRPRPLQPPT